MRNKFAFGALTIAPDSKYTFFEDLLADDAIDRWSFAGRLDYLTSMDPPREIVLN